MMEIVHFSPGKPVFPGPPLAAYRPSVLAGALEPYLDAYTQPGYLVIDLFCHSPVYIEEAVRTGRRALGVNVNAALLLAASLGFTNTDKQDLVAAFTRLAETRKGQVTLQAYIESLYETTCATCGAATTAEAFIWERDGQAPIAKRYRCKACGDADQASQAPTNEADRAAAARFERRSLSYWLLLDRAASRDTPHRERVAALLELYTPRNVTAVSDLLVKYEGLKLDVSVRQVLDALLLDTLDRATSLRSPDAPGSRARSLQRPAMYVEENVWHLLECALQTWHAAPALPFPRATDLSALLNPKVGEPEASFFLAPLSSGQARRELSPGSVALIVVDPARPDTALWHLSAVWSHWLWGARASAPLVPFLARRRMDRDWHWRGLRNALASVKGLLQPGGRMVCLFQDDDPAILEAVAMAAAGAGYRLAGWGARAPGQVCLTLRPEDDLAEGGARATVDLDALSRPVTERAADAAMDALRARGEPVTRRILHQAIYVGLFEKDWLAQVASAEGASAEPLSWLGDIVRSALEGAPLQRLPSPSVPSGAGAKGDPPEPLWWLDATGANESENPLSDRVEMAVAETLRDLEAISEVDLQRRVYARFPGIQTPGERLIQLCLLSYGYEHAPGSWRLRAEDDLEARAQEVEAILAGLAALGQRLDFSVTLDVPSAGQWGVCWEDETGHTPYVFAVRTSAVLGDLLLNPPPLPTNDRAERHKLTPSTIPCLVLPGSRAPLVAYKLRHDARMHEQRQRYGWQFLKFRHLRHLVQEVAAKQLDRYAFQAALGLDPAVEQEEAQLSLW